ncbi:MAG: cytochrome c oxidase accessory protein CcoG [Alphaproteobacteria bacterium]|nr:cytochrome c oxidase accessory protein CcoG [Alphaproteobacteria bacterium]
MNAAPTQPMTADIGIIDVEPVNAAKHRPLYEKRVRIFPRAVSGRYRTMKWAALATILGLYYILPWLRWDRGSNAPDQAVLIDFPGQRFHFFFIEIWPQEVYYITGLLILAALILFLVSSVAGRIWCGYACPQTVWTDLFMWVERRIEGNRNAQMRLDRTPWTAQKLAKRAAKHGIWLLIAVATGGAWVFYFADAPTLAADLIRFEAPMVSYLFIGLLTGTTYLLAGHAREQVCTFMCPWPRIQGAMLDEHSMLVTYRRERGEPRGAHKRGQSWEGRGDCVDCKTCVAVCPMGIDIRDGNQLECINCALCVDACNDIMDRVGRPQGLIAYDTLAGLETQSAAAWPAWRRLQLLRPRTLLYAMSIVLVGSVMLATLLSRADTDIAVLRDRNPLFVQLSDGSFRNGYTIKLQNKRHEVRRFRLLVEGLPGAVLSAVGGGSDDTQVGPDQLRTLRVYVAAPLAATPGTVTPFEIIAADLATGERYPYATTFRRAE